MDELRADYHDRLAELHRDVEALGADVVGMARSAIDALLEGDEERLADVVSADREVDRRYAATEREVYRLMVTQHPVARDLRLVVGSLRVAQELERCGDLACAIARRARRLDETVLTPRVRLVVHEIGAEAVSMLAAAVRAYGVLDADAAAAVVVADEALDDLYAQLLRALFELQGVGGEPMVEAGLVARFLERLGDHATVMAERVLFIANGSFEPNDADSG